MSHDFPAQIRAAGLRVTTSRVAVLERLAAAKSPLSHADLAEQLVPKGFDRATVYRNLIDLAEVGIVARAELGDHVWRYELRRTDHARHIEHPHFVCTTCGEVTCLDSTAVTLTPAPGSKKSVIGEVTEVLVKGRCERCKA